MPASTTRNALPYPLPADPADVPADVQSLANRLDLLLGGGLSPSPPASPVDGELWATSPLAGVVWLFRYNAGSASAYKWEFIGGPPLYSEVVTAEALPGPSGYSALATAGPSVTLPRAGDYDVSIGCRSEMSLASTLSNMSYDIGATAAVDTDSILKGQASSGYAWANLSRSRRKTGLAASTTLTAKYKSPNAATATFADRWISVLPVRVS